MDSSESGVRKSVPEISSELATPAGPARDTGIRLDWRYIGGIFIAVVLGLLLFGHHQPIPKTFDAAGYWGLAGRFIKDNHFSLLNYNSTLRGYLFPLLLVPFRVVDYLGKWPEGLMQQLLGAAQAALLFGWALPKLYSSVRPAGTYSTKRRLLFISLGLFFWGGYFAYTLSDFPAILAFSVGLLLLLSRQPRLWSIMVAGALLGAALNTRPFYLLSLPLVVLLVWKLKYNSGLWQRNLLSCAMLMAGMAIVLAPQWCINSSNFNRNTPLVLAKATQKDDLFLAQLVWGLDMLKIETSLGGAANGRNAQVIYGNPVGRALLNQPGVPRRRSFSSWQEYVILALQHPVEIVATYLLHVFAGFDQHYATPYSTEDVNKFTLLIPLVNYTLLFIAVLLLLYGKLAVVTTHQTLVLLAWLIPCGITVMVAMENRFLLPAHLFLYGLVAFETGSYRALLTRLLLHKWKILALYGAFVALLFMLSVLIYAGREINYV